MPGIKFAGFLRRILKITSLALNLAFDRHITERFVVRFNSKSLAGHP